MEYIYTLVLVVLFIYVIVSGIFYYLSIIVFVHILSNYLSINFLGWLQGVIADLITGFTIFIYYGKSSACIFKNNFSGEVLSSQRSDCTNNSLKRQLYGTTNLCAFHNISYLVKGASCNQHKLHSDTSDKMFLVSQV